MEQRIFDQAARSFESGMYSDQRTFLRQAVTSDSDIIALFRCARRQDTVRQVAVLITTTQLAWHRSTVFSGSAGGTLAWGHVLGVETYQLSRITGIKISPLQGAALEFDGIVSGFAASGYEVDFSAQGLVPLVMRLREAAYDRSTARTGNPEQRLFDTMADQLEGGSWRGQRGYLQGTLTDRDRVLALCRCARRQDSYRQTLLLVTSERLSWAREALDGERETGNLRWVDVDGVEAYSARGTDGVMIHRRTGASASFDYFSGAGVHRKEADVAFDASGMLALFRRLAAEAGKR